MSKVNPERKIAFLKDLKALFEKHGVDGCYYGTDDDGLHITIDGDDVLQFSEYKRGQFRNTYRTYFSAYGKEELVDGLDEIIQKHQEIIDGK